MLGREPVNKRARQGPMQFIQRDPDLQLELRNYNQKRYLCADEISRQMTITALCATGLKSLQGRLYSLLQEQLTTLEAQQRSGLEEEQHARLLLMLYRWRHR